jgi:cyclophilin family peptidyl-prolyl cis-trans isomerase
VVVGLTFLALTAGPVFSAFAQDDGIYAEFNTSMGSYTCRLEYALAPKAVANFIGLATGERSWLDLPSGQVKTNPFYNATTFHRVIAGFMNQGGSLNGQGTDGPGYQFLDEFSPSLRHDGFGVLSMANSGPDSNGSQYFITVSAQPQLDNVHTVFGRLSGGSNVVYAINRVATGANDKPLTNVVVQNVVIRRIGAAAEAFDVHAKGLPLVTNLNLQIAKSGAYVTLSFSNPLNVDNRLYYSSGLRQWTGVALGIVTTPLPNAISTSTDPPMQFFHMAQIQYQDSLFVPFTLHTRTLTLDFSDRYGTVVIAFNNSSGGSYTWNLGKSGSVLNYGWVQNPYRGRLSPILFSGLDPMVLHLDFDSATAGTFKGTAYSSVPFAVSGTFSATP